MIFSWRWLQQLYIEEKQSDEENLSDIFNINSKMHEILIKRKRRSHINTKLQLFIKDLFDKFPNHHKLIKNIYKLSSSTYYRILKLKILNSRNKIDDEDMIPQKLSLEAQVLIQKLVTPPQHPITIRKLMTSLNSELGEQTSYYRLRTFVKEELRLSYK